MVWCSCCGAAYSVEAAADVIAAIERDIRIEPIDCTADGGWSPFGPQVCAEMRAHGISTLGDALDEGAALLDVRGIGPKTLEWFEEMIVHIRGRFYDWRRVTLVPPGDATNG